MKLTLTILMAAALAIAQTPTLLLTGPSAATPGSTVTVTASLTGTAGNISAFQDSMSLVGAPLLLSAIGTPSSLPAKGAFCVGAGPFTCITVGVVPPPTLVNGVFTAAPTASYNREAIPDGAAVGTITFTIPSTAPSNSTVTLTAGSVLAAMGDGTPVAISGSSVTIQVIDLKTVASLAFAAWYQTQSAQNFTALVKAIAAAQ